MNCSLTHYLKQYATYLYLILMVALLSSCADDDETTPKTRTELLTSGKWKTDKALLNGQEDETTTQVFEKMQIEFFTNGTYRLQNIDNTTGNWQLNADETQVWLDPNEPQAKYLYIRQLTTRKFDFYYNENAQRYDIYMVKTF